MLVIYFVYPSYGEQRARFVRMTYVWWRATCKVRQDDDVFSMFLTPLSLRSCEVKSRSSNRSIRGIDPTYCLLLPVYYFLLTNFYLLPTNSHYCLLSNNHFHTGITLISNPDILRISSSLYVNMVPCLKSSSFIVLIRARISLSLVSTSFNE